MRYSNPRSPVGPWAVTIPPLGFDVLVEPVYPYRTKEQDPLSWATSHTSSANDPMCHARGFTASIPCVSVHMLLASVFPRVDVLMYAHFCPYVA